MGRRRLITAVAFALALLFVSCRSTPTPEEWQPHESLLTVLAELELHRGEDLYQFGHPRDVTGQNVFRATLVRVENWRLQWPGRWEDITLHAKALCHEELGNWETATALFDEVVTMGTALSGEAAAHRDVCDRLADLTTFEPQGNTLAQHLIEIEDHVERWRRESVRRKGTPWEDITMFGWEQSMMQMAEVLREVRHSLPDGDERYRQWCEHLIESHPDSNRIHRHWLRFGDYHYELAQRLVVFTPPQVSDFDLVTFNALVNMARRIYLQTEGADGYLEKNEARARLSSLENFAIHVRQEAQ